MKLLQSVPVLALVLLTALPACTQTPAWKGKITYNYSGEYIKQFDLSAKTDKQLMKEAAQPSIAPNGEIYFVDQNFKKRNVLIRKSNASFTQFRNVLDMTIDNPRYTQTLQEYSVIRGTGISAVLSSMSDPKVSPDGKYLSLTIYGYKGQGFEKNCVAVFDIATKKLVTKFEGKYYGNCQQG